MSEETNVPEVDPRDVEIAELKNQVRMLEGFCNAVATQRNEAQNLNAQYLSQMNDLAKGA